MGGGEFPGTPCGGLQRREGALLWGGVCGGAGTSGSPRGLASDPPGLVGTCSEMWAMRSGRSCRGRRVSRDRWHVGLGGGEVWLEMRRRPESLNERVRVHRGVQVCTSCSVGHELHRCHSPA